MAKTRNLINANSDKFDVVIARINELLDDLATEVITANTDTGGGVTVGNAYVTGILGGTTLVANTLRGGTISTPAPMNIGSNAIFDVTKSLINGNITINSTAIGIGNLVLTPTTLLAGNSTVNSLANSTLYSMANATASANMSLGAGFKIGVSTVNATGVYVGANVLVNATTIFMGNATVNTVIIPTLITLGGNLSINSSALGIGNSTANMTLSAVQSYMGNSTFFTTVTPGEIRVGNSTVNAVINSMGLTAGLQIMNDITLGNSTINVHVNTTTMTVGSNLVVNGSAYFVGNDTVFTTITNSSIQTAQTYMTNTALGVGTNAAGPSVFYANTTTLFVGNNTVNAQLNNSSLAIRGIVQATVNVITTGTSAQLVDSWTMAAFQSAEYTFSIKNNSANGFHFTKVAIIHDTVNAHVTEYATMITNSSLGTFSANANTTHIALYVTPIPAATSIKGTVTRFGV